MSTAEQIIADELWQQVDALGYRGRADDLAAHVVAALTNAGKAIVDPNALDSAIWLYLGDECDNANEPNYEENNYDAGFIAGLAHAQETIRAQLPGFLAAARVAEGGER
ncbi:hypothetical protein GS534_00910 [Rhodococcus hoagii]|nr:hypothetical protein [Prescottella equi]